MGDLPDFTGYGYEIRQELGANRSGGRITYLATEIQTERSVVIKQFQFAKTSSSWSAYDAHQREIEVLKGLQHAGIPAYLSSFQVSDGFCMVQEYKQASPLTVNRSFSGDDVRAIAVQILQILIYLQNRIPPIIHRDLKPDNILVSDDLNVYLVDFGFARVGDGEVGVSSVVKGTLGFMPPEQLFNRQLTEASDLYGLGMTLICLLTHTKPDDIGTLVDISYKIKFRHLVPKLSLPWVKWLEKMSEPRLKERYLNAREALKVLPNSPIHPPEVQMNRSNIQVKAEKIGQVISQSLEVTNVVPEIILTGQWEVQKHPQDPVISEGQHAWIDIKPSQFKSNQTLCKITFDTQKLMAGSTYQRTLLLHTNAFPKTYSVSIQVETASIPIRNSGISFYPLVALFIFVLVTCRFLLWTALPLSLKDTELGVVSFGLLLGTALGLQGAAWTLQSAKIHLGAQLSSFSAIFLAAMTLAGAGIQIENLSGSWDTILAGLVPGFIGGWLLGLGLGFAVEKLLETHIQKTEAIALSLTTMLLAVVISLGWLFGFGHSLLVLVLAVLGLLLGSLLVHAPLKQAKKIATYRQLERNRIRPEN